MQKALLYHDVIVHAAFHSVMGKLNSVMQIFVRIVVLLTFNSVKSCVCVCVWGGGGGGVGVECFHGVYSLMIL